MRTKLKGCYKIFNSILSHFYVTEICPLTWKQYHMGLIDSLQEAGQLVMFCFVLFRFFFFFFLRNRHWLLQLSDNLVRNERPTTGLSNCFAQLARTGFVTFLDELPCNRRWSINKHLLNWMVSWRTSVRNLMHKFGSHHDLWLVAIMIYDFIIFPLFETQHRACDSFKSFLWL